MEPQSPFCLAGRPQALGAHDAIALKITLDRLAYRRPDRDAPLSNHGLRLIV